MIRKTTPSRRRAGFTLTDLIVVIAVIVIMLSVQMSTNASARATARRMQNSTQLRGIHQGLVTYSNSNKDFFAGLRSDGTVVRNGPDSTGNSGHGDHIEARFWILLDGEFFTPEYAISPSETADITPYDTDQGGPVLWSEEQKNYSFALLGLRAAAPNNLNVRPSDAPRMAEWRTTLNSQAIVVSDRNTGTNATNRVSSIHTGEDGEWSGSVLWNDNHVNFESEQFFETRYANGLLNTEPGEGGTDNIFEDEAAPVENQRTGANGLMVIADNNTVHAGE